MSILITTAELEWELDQLELQDPDQADTAWLLLQELYDNRDLLSELQAPEVRYGHIPLFEFKAFEEAMNAGYRIYFLKYYETHHGHLCDHRIFLGHNPHADAYHGLAIEPRDTAYLPDHPRFAELLDRYDKYRIPRIP